MGIGAEEAEFCRFADLIDRHLSSLEVTDPYLHLKNENLSESTDEVLKFIGAMVTERAPHRFRSQKTRAGDRKRHVDLVHNWEEVEPIFARWEKQRDYRI